MAKYLYFFQYICTCINLSILWDNASISIFYENIIRAFIDCILNTSNIKISMLQYSCKNHFTTLILVKMYQIQITTGMSRGTQNWWYLILVIVYLDTCQLKRKTNFLLFQEFSVSPAHSCKAEYNIINKSAHFNWIRYYQHYISMWTFLDTI